MVCSIGAVAIAAFERPRMRWERVVRIWLDGVRAEAASTAAADPALSPPG